MTAAEAIIALEAGHELRDRDGRALRLERFNGTRELRSYGLDSHIESGRKRMGRVVEQPEGWTARNSWEEV